MERYITIRNDYHNTEARIRRVASDTFIVSRCVVQRVRRELCGIADCKCGGALSQRGPQEVVIEALADGRARLYPKPMKG